LPTSTYTLIATATAVSATPSVTFSSIPQTYKDLIITTETAGAAAYFALSLNGSTSNFTVLLMEAAGGANYYYNDTISFIGNADGAFITDVFNYSSSTQNKTFLSRYPGNDDVIITAGRWAVNDAITSLTIRSNSGNISAGSKFYLYGVIQ
jgi:hypothetical protein